MTGSLSVVGLTPVAQAQGTSHDLKPLWERKISKTEAVTGFDAKKGRATAASGRKKNESQAKQAKNEQRTTWPGSGEGRLTVGAAGRASATEVGGLPLALNAPKAEGSGGKAAPALDGGPVRVKVLGHRAATDLGIKGVLLTAQAPEAGTGEMSIGYGAFASAYGGGWSGRLGLVSLPQCALTTPEKAECRTATEVASANDVSARTVTGAVTLSATVPTVLALAATTSAESASGSGTYEATPLSPSATWESGDSSGAFTWSYPIGTPPAPGPSPSLSLAYDSGSTDGKTASTNNQSTQVGEGFDLSANSYVERTYGSCDDDGQTDKNDLCWKFDNASLVLNGKSTELVKDDTTGVWRLKNDDASTVTLSTGADNGDDNGESWTVTTGDGTRYAFGLDKLPGAGTERTNSVWTVPVFGDDSGEPGYDKGSTFADRAVTQAWRWNLDYVEDTHDNAMSYWYTKETNSYGKNGASTATAGYTRGGYLNRIQYGQRAASLFSGVTSAKVDFTYAERCTASDCAELKDATAPNWPDVPFDSICASGATCKATGPTFFSRKRLTRVDTSVWSAATSAFTPVDTWDLTQEYLDGGDIGDSTDQTLTLKSIKRTGRNGTAISMNPVAFTYDMRPNRVDGDRDDILPLTKPRIRTVTTETGAVTDVTFSGQECVRGSGMPTAEDSDTASCYPQYWHVNGAKDATVDWFHKYRVTDVVTSDEHGPGETMESHYAYSGAAWHYNDSPFTPADERTWSVWRGYRNVTVTQGSGSGQSKVTSVYLQGMDGDRLLGSDGKLDPTARRSVTVPGTDFDALDVADQKDSEPYSGALRQQTTYNGTLPVSTTVYDPWSKKTATQHKSYADTEAYFARTGKETAYTYLTASGNWRAASTSTTYDDYGMATKADSTGDTTRTGDETCTRTWYARNDSLGINSLTSRTRVVGRACSAAEADLSLPAAAATAGDVVSDTATVYDNPNATAWSASQTPTLGEATWTGRASAYPAAVSGGERTPSAWQTVGTSTFDVLGRPLITTDAGGNATTTTYTPTTTGPLTRTWTKNPKLYSTYTYTDPARGLPTQAFDANGNITETAYDALGRTTAVWLPNRSHSANQSANQVFAYSVSNTAPSWSSSGTLREDGTYATTYTLLDSLLRPVETQAPGATSGRILTYTHYDNRGLATETYADIYDSAAPSGTYTQLEYGEAPSLTTTGYDAAGRASSTTFRTGGEQKWETTTTYTGDSTATTGLTGGSATRTITDALGRTTETRKYAGTSAADSEYGALTGPEYSRTRFTYTPDGKQKTVTGPDGAAWSYTYDLYGRQVTANDPDKGATTSGYTALDQVSWTKGATGQAVILGYDVLGRVTDTWKASAGANLADATVLAAQKTAANTLTHTTYDTATLGKGLPAVSTRYVGGTAGKAYAQSVTAYDSRANSVASSLTIPSDDALVTSGALASSTVKFTSAYNIDGTLDQTTEPAAGGLAAETVEHGYSAEGLATSLTGGGKGIVLDATYTDLAQLATLKLGVSEATGTGKVDIANGYEDGTHRLLQTQVHASSQAYDAMNVHYAYDTTGNITRISDTTTLGGTGAADTQCFGYDGYQRLTEAWTPADGDCATTGRTTANLGGAAPYWTSYTYTAGSQRNTETTHTADTSTTTTSCYRGGTTQPHTLLATVTSGTCIGATAEYGYDAEGNTTSRPDGSTTQNLDWDAEGKLSRLTENPAGAARATDYLYGAGGNLLLRRSAASDGETVLYLGATEVHLKSGKKWAARSYSFGGSTVAVRSNQTGTEKISYLAGDQHGSASVAIASDTQALTKRYLTPFGAERGAGVSWVDDKAFLGKSADAETGLTHVDAREYDPLIGQFISVDPVLDTTDGQSLNGYAYAGNNPATYSDPTGERLADCVGGWNECGPVRSSSGNNGGNTHNSPAPVNKGPASLASTGNDSPTTPNGNAPFNSRKQTPSEYNYFTNHVLPQYETLIKLAEIAGWDLSVKLWKHYRDASGTDYDVDFNYLRGDPALREVVQGQVDDWQAEALTTCRSGGACEFTADSKWLGVDLATKDNHFGIGHAQVRVTGSAMSDGKSVGIKFNVQVYKDWNFDKGETVLGFNLGRYAAMHEYGYGQDFVMTSSSPTYAYNNVYANSWG